MENVKPIPKFLAVGFVILTVINLLQVWKVYAELNKFAADRARSAVVPITYGRRPGIQKVKTVPVVPAP